jgi:hypothetical protein
MLFPDSSFYDNSDRFMQDKISKFKNDNLTFNRLLWQEQLIDTMYCAGASQTLMSSFYQQFPASSSSMFNFNHLRSIKNAIGGRQRQQRKSMIMKPMEGGTQETADQYTDLLMHVGAQQMLGHTISDAFDQALVTGLSLIHVYQDFRKDPVNGDIKVDALTYDSFIMDSLFRKRDLSDCNGVWRRTFVAANELPTLLPDAAKDLIHLGSGSDASFNYMPEVIYASKTRNRFAYDEFYYRIYRDATILTDPQTGLKQEWKGTKDQLRDYISYFPQISVNHTQVPSVNLAILVNGKLFFDDRAVDGCDEYPFIPVFGYFDPSISDYRWKIQGIIRNLRDSAFLENRVQTILLKMLESKINTGWIYIDGKVINPTDTYKTGEGQNIIMKPGSVIGQDISPIQAQEIPASYFQLLEGLSKNPERISGVSQEMLGSATDTNSSGLRDMLRQRAGTTTIEELFDNLDRSQYLVGKRIAEIIQHNWTPGKVERILGKKASPFFYKVELGEYDVAIEDGVNTTSQKQLVYSQIRDLLDAGIHIPEKYILKYVTISDKDELLKDIEEEKQQAAQQQQQQMQVQMQQMQMQAKAYEAKSMADIGLYEERHSRVPENLAMAEERKAASVKDEEIALLNMVKALKEIDGIDLAHMKEAIALMGLIKGQEQQQELHQQTMSQPQQENGQKTGLKDSLLGQKTGISNGTE